MPGFGTGDGTPHSPSKNAWSQSQETSKRRGFGSKHGSVTVGAAAGLGLTAPVLQKDNLHGSSSSSDPFTLLEKCFGRFGARGGNSLAGVAPIERLYTIQDVSEFLRSRDLRLSDFALQTTVGTGTFGRVRLTKFRGGKIGIPLAMKMMKKSEIIRLRQVEHIRSEKEILSMISHPFIVNMFGCFQDKKRLYMVFEYIAGGEIFALLRKAGRLTPEHTRFYIGEIVLAVEYLHSVMIVYRDLKPENLLIDAYGHLKITDFGFAKYVEDLTWTLCGTPEYLAPEIIQSKGHNRAVDWWALGVLMFEFLAGYPPFYDENPIAIYQKVLAAKFVAPKQMDVKARDLIKRFLTVERTKRIGCLAGGVNDIKDHKFFKGAWSWQALAIKHVQVPYVPQVRSMDDVSQFENYPDSEEGSAEALSKEDDRLFENW